jgi:O-6-methylguanine DNA methyltransferase
MSDRTKTINYCIVSTRIGWILIAESPDGICLLDFLGEEKPSEATLLEGLRREFPKVELAVTSRKTPLLAKAAGSVSDYVQDGAPPPELPLDIQKGTPFQQEVWAALRRIPFGETRSYGQIAKAVGRPKASRAVGHACGKNPVPLFVPCHRVLGSGGALGGFSAGLHVKEALLNIERAPSRNDGESPP